MNGNRAVVTAAVVVLVIILGTWLMRRSSGGSAVDLLQTFDTAAKSPAGESFPIVEATLNGETLKAIAAPGGNGSRITWKVQVPDNGWLRVHVGLKPESWDLPGDGVKFLVLASDGRTSEELFSQGVDPVSNPADRKWYAVMVDLSAYGGEQIDLIFNTYASMPDRPADTQNDMPLWGAPEIVIR
jgi:hypothetical protein